MHLTRSMSKLPAQSYVLVFIITILRSFGRDSVGQNLHCWQEGSNTHNP